MSFLHPGLVSWAADPGNCISHRAQKDSYLELMLHSHHLEFLVIFEPGVWHFSFAPGPANHIACLVYSPVWDMCVCDEGRVEKLCL